MLVLDFENKPKQNHWVIPLIPFSVERYNPEEDRWTRVANTTAMRFDAAVAALDNILYVVGGVNHANGRLKYCEKYNADTDTWSPITGK